jgi:hypothetical protein
MQAAFGEAARLGHYAVLISQWSALDTGAVKDFMAASRRHGLVPIIGLSPTLLTGGRKELDVPRPVRQAAGHQLSYANPVVRAAFVDAAVKLAELKPPYLCLATEINFLAIGNLREYLLFSEAYKQAYQAVKQVSPTTQVFVSFQWDLMRLIDDKEPNRLHEHGKVIDLFRPALDRIAITAYPGPHFASARQVPADYFRSLDRHVDRSEPIIIMEIGWPTSGNGNESEQAAFIARLPELLHGLRVEVLAWALLHDVRLAEFGPDLNSVGLRTSDGRAKLGLDALRRLQ